MPKRTIKQRANNAFEEALCLLLLDKPLEKITVKEICEEADYTVTAFYRNNEDKYDFAKKIIEKEAKFLFETNYNVMLEADYAEIEDDRRKIYSNESVQKNCEGYFNHVYEHSNVYRCIVSDKLAPNTVMEFTRSFSKYSVNKLIVDDSFNSNEYDYYIGIFISNFLFTVSYWIDNKFTMTAEEISNLFLRAFSSQSQIIKVNRLEKR